MTQKSIINKVSSLKQQAKEKYNAEGYRIFIPAIARDCPKR